MAQAETYAATPTAEPHTQGRGKTITLLDGGIGQLLVTRSGKPPTPLWSTKVMMDHPNRLTEIHAEYFAAGARLATTNTYAIHRDRLAPFGLEDRFEALIAQALAEAEAARARFPGRLLAGSIGPLRASYRPEIHPPKHEAVPLYAEVARLLKPKVDLILCETVASLAHADAVLTGAAEAKRPVWLSVTVDDEDGSRLRSGEPVAALEDLVLGRADAVLANCSAPEAIPQALAVLRRFGLPFGAYANGFRQITKEFLQNRPTVDVLPKRPELTPERYAEHALRWVDEGATIVGGCCETTPAHIAAIARRLVAAGFRLA